MNGWSINEKLAVYTLFGDNGVPDVGGGVPPGTTAPSVPGMLDIFINIGTALTKNPPFPGVIGLFPSFRIGYVLMVYSPTISPIAKFELKVAFNAYIVNRLLI